MFPQFGSKRLVETAQRIGHFDFKSRAGLKSQFGEGPMTEAVDRLNRRAIEAEQRLPEFADAVLVNLTLVFIVQVLRRRAGDYRFERRADSRAQLTGCFLGERHNQDSVDGGVGLEQNFDDQIFDGVGLASACACLYQRMPIERYPV